MCLKILGLLVLDPKLLLLDATPDLLLGVGGFASIPKDDLYSAIHALGEHPVGVSSHDLQQQLEVTDQLAGMVPEDILLHDAWKHIERLLTQQPKVGDDEIMRFGGKAFIHI